MHIIVGGAMILVGLAATGAMMHLTGAGAVGCGVAETLAGPVKVAVELINVCWLG